jgi:coenzyme F420 hydrogenase subunit beta
MVINYQEELINKIISNNLCSGCGTCAGVCLKDCINFDSESYVPIFDNESCVNCGLCYKSCPGKGFQFLKLKDDAVYWDDRIGPYISFITCYSTDELLRENGASGGTISTIFKYVLEKRLVQKILCVKKNGEKFEAFLTDDITVLSQTQGSKYIPIPLNVALKVIINNEYVVAVVGTPCELQGMQLASEQLPKLRKLIKYKIGVFCGFVQPKECLLVFRKYLHAEDADWNFDGWRYGEYPGYVHFTNTKTGERKYLLIYEALDMAVPFYSLEKCFMCPDGTNMCADFAFGDIHSRGKNENSGIIRTKKGEDLIAAMCSDGYLVSTELKLEEAMKGTVGSVSYLKGMRSLLYMSTNRKAVPKYDITFNNSHYSKFKVLQNRIHMMLYRFVRKPCILHFFEMFPKLQMRVGRYVYTFPNRVLLYRFLRKVRDLVKRK